MDIRIFEAGIVFGPDEINTAHGQMIAKLYDDLCRAQRDAEWWRKVATGELLTQTVATLDDEEPF